VPCKNPGSIRKRTSGGYHLLTEIDEVIVTNRGILTLFTKVFPSAFQAE
jgi:hypothetical protein